MPRMGQAKADSKSRTYGTIGEEPIETHRIDTPPKESKGAAKKSVRKKASKKAATK